MGTLGTGETLRGMQRDGRYYDRRTQEAMRLMAVQRVREGEHPSAVMASLGLCRTTIYKWLTKVRGRGAGIRRLRARHGSGRPRTLTPAQERQVFRWVNGKNPCQYGFDFGLWTRAIVQTLIRRKFGVRLSLASVGTLLARQGLTPQKPLQRAYQRDPEAIERWQTETYPEIARQAKREGADIYFWDESGFRADQVQGRTWAEKGHTPVVEVPGQRQGVSAASAVNAKGAFWFATYKGGLNAKLFVTLLKQLMYKRRRPLYLILDNLPAHKTQAVKTYVASTAGRLALHFLPGYAPELNPDELVWSHAKRTRNARRPLRQGEKLALRIRAQLAAIGRDPALVRSFFHHPSVAYITDV